MAFIIVLIIAATAIAGSAAFFSVYGLAFTFSGTFWSVVVMGSSLELGKLVAASYLYRYWDKTHRALKWYLMFGVAALMILTSTGIFGYLSSGYQTDVLPLKQAEEQVKVLEEEKTRLIARKTQIDNQIAQLPQNSVKGRTQLIKGFKDEQATVTARIGELDKEILENKTKLIQTQAHIGPITYIATAFGLDSDNATKYLIYLIIFAFDPMAVALTLAVNIAQKIRREEMEEEKKAAAIAAREAEEAEREERKRKLQAEHDERMFAESLAAQIVEHRQPVAEEPKPIEVVEPEPEPEPTPIDDAGAVFIPHEDERPAFELTPPEPIEVVEPEPEPEPEIDHSNQLELNLEKENDSVEVIDQSPPVNDEQPAEDVGVAEEQFATKPPTLDLPPPQQRHYRPYSGLWNGEAGNMDAKLSELVSHYNWLKQRRAAGEELSRDELWEFQAIEDVLKKHGFNIYL